MKILTARTKNQLLRLADSMERGAKLRPKARGELFKNGASCALGAVYEDTFGVRGGAYSKLQKKYPVLQENVTGDSWKWVTLQSAIVRRNDELGWSRIRIARWLRKLAS